MANLANISRIESWLHGKLREFGYPKCYAGSLPSTLSPDAKEMAVVDVWTTQEDSLSGRTLGTAYANVFIYAKPDSSGRKDVAALDRAEDVLHALSDEDAAQEYFLSEQYVRSGYEEAIGYHYAVASIKIVIS